MLARYCRPRCCFRRLAGPAALAPARRNELTRSGWLTAPSYSPLRYLSFPAELEGGTPREVLLIGSPALTSVSEPVHHLPLAGEDLRNAADLCATLRLFQQQQRFGRAIAAPQVGWNKRVIAFGVPGKFEGVLVNPEITWRSKETMFVLDDCMSFPELLVRVKRHCSISIRFVDYSGDVIEWNELDEGTSELLQHEIDHLDGVTFIERAAGTRPFVHRRTQAKHVETEL